jgi:hypothetical protein
MEKSKSDDEESQEAKAKERTKRIIKVTQLFLGNPELEKLMKKPMSMKSSTAPKTTSSVPHPTTSDKAKDSKLQTQVKATNDDKDQANFAPKPGRPKKAVEKML